MFQLAMNVARNGAPLPTTSAKAADAFFPPLTPEEARQVTAVMPVRQQYDPLILRFKMTRGPSHQA
ncbi:hypothetical protein KTQ42_21815 [Noviherbaspirillum sp. L7-7A]|uniref:hypothetical protein n=1 Tax=Noviherbaspirillum sp. L7-7A TaxID=2850560 RepID=UPI001C2C4F7E|nr:hypothetical protein [Noviherbaspirillum sp. L7-7A]MBV0881917.1 hypothetical protein [Noviherbaspirillum sp. L7-7A]